MNEYKKSVTYNSLGNDELANKSLHEAIKNYNLAIENNPNYAIAYNNRGLAKYYLQDYKSALYDVNTALNLDKNLKIAYYNRALIKKMIDKEDSAIEDCKILLSLDSGNNSKILSLMGNLYIKKNDIRNAEHYLSKSIELDENNYEAHLNIGILLFNKRKFNHSLKHFDKIVTNKIHAEEEILEWAFFYIAKIFIVNKNYDNALKKLKEAKNYSKNGSGILSLMGFCYKRKGELEKAIKLYSEVIDKDAISSEIYIEFSECYKAKGEFKKALDILTIGHDRFPNDRLFDCYIGKILYDNFNDAQGAFIRFSKIMSPDEYMKLKECKNPPLYYVITINYLNKIFDSHPHLKKEFITGTPKSILKAFIQFMKHE